MAALPHPDTVLFLSHICITGLNLGSLPSTLLYSDTPPPLHPPSEWLRLFSSQNFSRKNTPTISTWLSFLLTLPMKMEQTECSKILAYKVQRLGNHPKKITQQSEHGQILKSKTHYNFFCQGADWIQQTQCKATTYLNHAIILKVTYPHCVLYMCSVIHNTLSRFSGYIFGFVN
jgi:hypothetical protein